MCGFEVGFRDERVISFNPFMVSSFASEQVGVRASTVASWVKLPPVIMTSNMYAGISPGFSTSDPISPHNEPEKSVEDGPNTWTLHARGRP